MTTATVDEFDPDVGEKVPQPEPLTNRLPVEARFMVGAEPSLLENSPISDRRISVAHPWKKQKQEEAAARRQVEATLGALRTEQRQQEQKLSDALRNGATLAPEIPELDTNLLGAVEQLPKRT